MQDWKDRADAELQRQEAEAAIQEAQQRNLPEWMAERHPTPELKARILEALYQKHGYTQGDEDLPMTLMDRHRVFVRKREAEKEYAEYEESLKLKPQIVPTTPEQLRLAEERRLHPLDKWQRTTLEKLHQQGRLEKVPEGISQQEFEKSQINRAIREGMLPYSTEKYLPKLTKSQYKELQVKAREAREAAARWERNHPQTKPKHSVGRDL